VELAGAIAEIAANAQERLPFDTSGESRNHPAGWGAQGADEFSRGPYGKSQRFALQAGRRGEVWLDGSAPSRSTML
jgi:hypothetical protein